MSDKSKSVSEGDSFGSRIGFVLAAAGSAVGLGNIWRFPYLAAKYGGGIFLLIYIIFAVTFGFSLMLTEIAIGRRTGRSAIGAYKAVNRSFSSLGILAAAIPVLILPYYCVIGGWVLKYTAVFITGNGTEAAEAVFPSESEPDVQLTFFEHFTGLLAQPTIFFIIFVLLTSVAVFLGVEKGIEKISKLLMPVLLIIIIGIAVYTLSLEGAADGLRYYLLPNFSDFTFSKLLRTIAAACGQLFYSMSLAMGIMITYGSYMRREDSLESSVRQIEFFDTVVAILSGMIIVPAVFIFSGGDPTALNKGAGLMFITLPKVFDSMPAGKIIGAAFFILVALAALTSSISLMETIAAIVMEKFSLSRKISCIIIIGTTLLLGMLSVLGYSVWSEIRLFGMQILDFIDFTANNLMMPVLAFLTCILIGYVVRTKYVEEEVLHGEKEFRSKLLYKVMIKYVCPACMLMILLTPFVTEI